MSTTTVNIFLTGEFPYLTRDWFHQMGIYIYIIILAIKCIYLCALSLRRAVSCFFVLLVHVYVIDLSRMGLIS